MSERYYNLDPELLHPFEIGALILAILAWPEPGEEEARRNGATALAALTLIKSCDDYPEEAEHWQSVFPEYAAIDFREVERRLKTFDRRMRDRGAAARMARGFFQEALTGDAAVLPQGMARLSLNELSKLVQAERGLSDPEMLERYVWRKSRSVIHLAVAFDVYGAARNPTSADVGYPMSDGDLHAKVIALAAAQEEIVLSDKRFGVSPDSIIQLRQPGLEI
jgi:hypothetical protein